MDRFQALRSFAKVVELGSFARAAERLSVSTSAVSRQVADLEATLDVRLLNRTTRKLSLTEAGFARYERRVALLADPTEAGLVADGFLRSESTTFNVGAGGAVPAETVDAPNATPPTSNACA